MPLDTAFEIGRYKMDDLPSYLQKSQANTSLTESKPR